jgi:hypothetical protein
MPTGDELPKMDLMLKTKVFKSQLLTVGVEVTVKLQIVCNYWSVCPMGRKTLLVLNCLSKHLENVPLITFLWLDHGCVSADI